MTYKEDKRLAFETVFDKGRVLVVVDITDPKVDLPDIARKRSPNGQHLPLHYSRTFVEANIKVKDDGIYADLAFGGVNSRCMTFVPWSAIRAILMKGMLVEQWPDPPFVPEQILTETTRPDAPADPNAMTADEIKWFSANVAEA